ncbi:unnamed protein product [Clavelina lepadiformis]|uniref:Solute carrier organic anion transporter family member n=1 Tax=Clavelina lepadiformis TaxID=159417 RepID=A0ABP0FS60_CLALP
MALGIRSFSFWLGCILFAEITAGAYFRSVITTIERRFGLPSTMTAVLTSSYQIGNLPFMVVISYIGSRYNRPRLIAMGSLLAMLGYMLTILPQFIGERYKFVDISRNTSNNEHVMTCSSSNSSVIQEQNCDEQNDAESSNLYIFILIGIMITGIGGSPLQPLGFSYVDDHATKHNAALYIGIVTSIGLAGPALGFVLGSVTMKMWVDFPWVDTATIGINPRHPAWVGAWWVGFIVTAIGIFLFGLPLWFYPKEMKQEIEDMKENGKSPANGFEVGKVKASFKTDTGVVEALKQLACNKRYILVLALWTSEAFRISGGATFMIKYLEVGFGKSASTSSFLIGALNLPFLILGTITGSFIIKRWKLETSGIIKISIYSLFGTLAFFGPLVFVGCDTIDIAGLTVPYNESLPGAELGSASTICNADCSCQDSFYAPVCGPDGITYVTPCHAGCTGLSSDDSGRIANYTSCACIPGEGHVGVGRCTDSNCENLAWLIIGFSMVANFLGGMQVTPIMVLILRSLPVQLKAFGMGLILCSIRLFGYIPGPVIYGKLIDRSCLLWSRKPCSDRAYCSVYDNAGFRYGFLGLMNAMKIVSITLALTYYFVFAKPDAEKLKKQIDQEKNGKLQNFSENAGLLQSKSIECLKQTDI